MGGRAKSTSADNNDSRPPLSRLSGLGRHSAAQAGWNKMSDLNSQTISDTTSAKQMADGTEEVRLVDTQASSMPMEAETTTAHGAIEGGRYRVYKRRWFGLVQLILLNIVISWDWISFAPVSRSSSEYFHVTESMINWLSTSFLLSFSVISPVVIYTLNKGGPKPAILAASVLTLIGNWIRYGGTKTNSYGVVMFGQILIGLAQPFVLSAPTRYSDLWFTSQGRISATAVASFSNPFGGALGQLINPFFVANPSDIPNMVLYVAIIATVACIPSFFIPAAPPSPPCPSAEEEKLSLRQTRIEILKSVEFWLIFVPFSVFVGFFNSISSLLNQILEPYGFSENDAGICGAILIVTGLVAAAIISPIVDRHKKMLLAIKVQVPIIGLCYLIFTWAPQTRNLAAPYAIAAFLGASSFSLVPIALEWLCEQTHPVSPEVTSVICWTGGQLLGGLFIIISDVLKSGQESNPPFNMKKALIFQAVISILVVPVPLCAGLFGRDVTNRRLAADKRITVQPTPASPDAV